MGYPPLDVENWAAQAAGLRGLFQAEMYGPLPEPETLISEARAELDGRFAVRTLVSRRGPRIEALCVSPPEEARATFVGVSFGGNPSALPSAPPTKGWVYPNGGFADHDPGRWDVEAILGAGFGLVTFHHADVVPDEPGLAHPALERLGCEGAVAAWAWGLLSVARSIPGPVVFMGHSRMGKAALLAGAFGGDGVACLQSGCGGAGPSRTTLGETVGQITERFPHWFSPRFASYTGREETLPFDQHALIALCAPKPVLLLNADDDVWANPHGQEAMAGLARPVYASMGATDALGTFRRPGGHSVTRDDWAAILSFFGERL